MKAFGGRKRNVSSKQKVYDSDKTKEFCMVTAMQTSNENL
jgi:hypothetical protein